MTQSTIPSFIRLFGFPLSPIELDRWLFEAAAAAALGVSIFAALECAAPDRASAQVIHNPAAPIAVSSADASIRSIEDLVPASQSAADLGKHMKMQLGSVWSFECQITVPFEEQHRCDTGDSRFLLPGTVVMPFDLQPPPAQHPDRIQINIPL